MPTSKHISGELSNSSSISLSSFGGPTAASQMALTPKAIKDICKQKMEEGSKGAIRVMSPFDEPSL